MHFRRQSDKFDVLRTVPIFRGLSQRQLAQVAKYADEVETSAGEVLVRQGDMGRELVFLVRGRARVEQDGRRIAELSSGDYFGEMSLLDGKPRSASVISEEPGTILVIHSQFFTPLLEQVPGLAQKMLVVLCSRVRKLEQPPID